MEKTWTRFAALLLSMTVIGTACGDDGDAGGAPRADAKACKDGTEKIVVGSANFTESQVLAEIYAQALGAEGCSVEKKLNIGSRETYLPALERGEINFFPEYVGTVLHFLGGEATTDSAATHARLKESFAKKKIVVLSYAPAQDKNGFIVTRETAQKHGLTKVSDLAKVDQDFVFGGPPECPKRPLCLQGLRDTYGLRFKEVKKITPGPITATALKGGEVDVALEFTTTGTIAANDFVLLEDDKGLQPAENIVPVVTQAIVDAYGTQFTTFVDSITQKITTDELTALNAKVDLDKEDAADAAKEWLVGKGFKV